MPTPPLQLPLDVVAEILKNVAIDSHIRVHTAEDDPRQASLRNLGSCALVSREWRDVALTIQWHSLALTLQATWKVPGVPYSRFTALLKFAALGQKATSTPKTLRAVITFFKENPHLAQYVRALALGAEASPCPPPWYVEAEASEVAELLSNIPNIQDLHLTNVFIKFDPNTDSRVVLPKLEQLSFSIVEAVVSAPVRTPNQLWTPLYLFPEIGQFVLRRVTAGVKNPYSFAEDALTVHSVRSRVRSLVLDTGDSGEVFLGQVLLDLGSVFQANLLHTLELHNVCMVDLPTHVVPAVQQVASTLKRLSLGFMNVFRSGEYH